MGAPGFPGDLMFSFGPIFIAVIFVIVISVILFGLVSSILQWNKNNQSPKLTVPAIVKTKRTHVRGSSHNHSGHVHSSSRTSYYATFEYESGDRSEFRVSGNEYGQLAEGDVGSLTFQGTRYLGFNRSSN